jgi:hypothetical protein
MKKTLLSFALFLLSMSAIGFCFDNQTGTEYKGWFQTRTAKYSFTIPKVGMACYKINDTNTVEDGLFIIELTRSDGWFSSKVSFINFNGASDDIYQLRQNGDDVDLYKAKNKKR